MAFDATLLSQQISKAPWSRSSLEAALRQIRDHLATLSATELGYIDGVTAGTGAVSNALVLDASGHVLMPTGGLMKFSQASLAAAGTTAADAAVVAAQFTIVTAADGAKGVALPAAADRLPFFLFNSVADAPLLVYPVNGGNDQINSIAEDLPFYLPPLTGQWFIAVSATQWWTQDTLAEPILTLSAATTLTAKQHGNRTLKLTGTGSSLAQTLPDATGSGVRFRFIVGAVNTSNHVVNAAASNVFKGVVTMLDNDSNAATAYAASGTDNTLTLNGTTTGGQIGDEVEFIDIAADTWAVKGALLVPAGSNVGDPFSAV